jgi:hypothetical protein
MARSSILVTAIGFEPEERQLLEQLAAHVEADDARFVGPFNLWLHFDRLTHADARQAVGRSLRALVSDPDARFLY